jgi:hypothetical protein
VRGERGEYGVHLRGEVVGSSADPMGCCHGRQKHHEPSSAGAGSAPYAPGGLPRAYLVRALAPLLALIS